MRSFVRQIALVVCTGLGLAVSTPSHAMSCDEIMTMVGLNIPPDIVADTMKDSGTTFTSTDIACLKEKGAPAEVIAAANALSNTPPPTPAPSTSSEKPSKGGKKGGDKSAFDAADILGGALSDLDDPDADSSSGGPADLEAAIEAYRAEKLLTASSDLWELLAQKKYPEQTSKIHYYLAKSLFDLEMFHSAQHHFMQVIRRGPKDPYFKYSLPRLVAISELTGNDYELRRIVDKIDPATFPRQASNHLNYLMGRKLYERDELAAASDFFRKVVPRSHHFLRAQFYLGVIHQEQGNLRSAVKAFREVVTAEPQLLGGTRTAGELEDIKDLAVLNTARIYFALRRFQEADAAYAGVERDSRYWPLALYERAWAAFWSEDLNHTLGLLLTTHSPYFTKNNFLPELSVLRALTFFNLCEYGEVERVLEAFGETYTPMQAELRTYVNRYKTEREIWDQAYDAYFQNPHEDSTLTPAFFARLLENQDLAAFVRQLDLMDAEIKKINAQKAIWRTSIGDPLKTVIETDRLRYKKLGGASLLREASSWDKQLESLLTQSEIIQFEVVDAQRADYQYLASQSVVVDAGQDRRIDFATSRDIIYWPFNGEFWRDELGYHRYTEHGSCE